MKSSKRIQRLAQKIAIGKGVIKVTYSCLADSELCQGKTDVTYVDRMTKLDYYDHLEQVFGPDWADGHIVSVEGLPYAPGYGAGMSFDDLFDMVDMFQEHGYYALEAAVELDVWPSKMVDSFVGKYNTFKGYGRYLLDRRVGSSAAEEVVDHIDFDSYIEEYGYYALASNGKIYAFLRQGESK